MKRFQCNCGQLIFFESPHCVNCGRSLGFIPEQSVLSALAFAGNNRWRSLAPSTADKQLFRMCANYSRENVCNWMVPAEDQHDFCRSCRLNDMIPDLSLPENRVYWARLEAAKRRLVYTLISLKLPLASKEEDPKHGLGFRFLADPDPTFQEDERVMTGHANGLITINLAEADDVAREKTRLDMNEPYRTLLGHFRHESGHYYWERLVRNNTWLEPFRQCFGDERQDYGDTMQRFYAQGPAPDWQQTFLSAYASSHPWEDWAETWAHYLHMVDTLETAADFGLAGKSEQPDLLPDSSFDEMLEHWTPLTLAINSLNRSMGMQDAYPFVLSPPAIEKLRFVHELIHHWRNGNR